jgi:uncharacterized metal-binding protein YceD (DUF177 family)
MMVKSPPQGPLLSRSVPVDDMPDSGLHVTVTATLEECEALRGLNAVVGLKDLRATFHLRHQGRAGVAVTGTVRADVVQTCVVSLEPFDATVDEAVTVQFLQPEALDAWHAARAKRPLEAAEEDDEDEPDTIVDGRIDLGLLTAEYLTLGLDPYPKKPGVRFEDVAPLVPPDEASPFAVLKTLRPDDA